MGVPIGQFGFLHVMVLQLSINHLSVTSDFTYRTFGFLHVMVLQLSINHLSVTSDFMLLLGYSDSTNTDCGFLRVCFPCLQAPVLYNGYTSGDCTYCRSGQMIVRCGTALRLSTVTISGCGEDLCFAIGKSVAASYHHDIIIDHQINPIRANVKLRTMHSMTN